MAHADVEPLLRGDQLQKAQHVLVVIQGLAHAHQHNVGDALPGVHGGRLHLGENLRGGKVAGKAALACGAKATVHFTPNLGGNANGSSVVVVHQHAFHMLPIGQAEQVFHRAVLGDALALHLGPGDVVPLGQVLPQGAGEVGHLGEVRHAPVEPAVHLLGPVLGQAQGGQLLLKLGQRLGFDVPGVGQLSVHKSPFLRKRAA